MINAQDDWETRVATAWKSAGKRPESETLDAIEALAAERGPSDAAAIYERASAFDFAGREADAEPLYREALAAGLDEHRRPRAVLQLASTLRNLGCAEESVDLLRHGFRDSDELNDARTAFLALALVDTGRPGEAASIALAALAPHVPEYSGAISHYARGIVTTPDDEM